MCDSVNCDISLYKEWFVTQFIISESSLLVFHATGVVFVLFGWFSCFCLVFALRFAWLFVFVFVCLCVCFCFWVFPYLFFSALYRESMYLSPTFLWRITSTVQQFTLTTRPRDVMGNSCRGDGIDERCFSTWFCRYGGKTSVWLSGYRYQHLRIAMRNVLLKLKLSVS